MVNHFSADLGILKMHNVATFRIPVEGAQADRVKEFVTKG
jgi:hypothetical protein